MKYLVTGSSGIVGSYIVKELLNRVSGQDQIVAVGRQNRYFYEDHPEKDSSILLECYCDLLHSPLRLISMLKPTHIFHCAGEGRQDAPARDIWRANVDTTLNLLEACKCLMDPVRFLYCSSAVVANGTSNVYGASKKAGELLVNSYHSDKLHTAFIRFPAVAGAGNKHGVVKDVVRKLLDKDQDKIILLNNSRKPLVFAKQLAEQIVNLSSSDYLHSIQVCSPDTIFVNSIAERAMKIIGIEKDIEWTSYHNEKVAPIKSEKRMYTCHTAVTLAIKDILEIDYGIFDNAY